MGLYEYACVCVYIHVCILEYGSGCMCIYVDMIIYDYIRVYMVESNISACMQMYM